MRCPPSAPRRHCWREGGHEKRSNRGRTSPNTPGTRRAIQLRSEGHFRGHQKAPSEAAESGGPVWRGAAGGPCGRDPGGIPNETVQGVAAAPGKNERLRRRETTQVCDVLDFVSCRLQLGQDSGCVAKVDRQPAAFLFKPGMARSSNPWKKREGNCPRLGRFCRRFFPGLEHYGNGVIADLDAAIESLAGVLALQRAGAALAKAGHRGESVKTWGGKSPARKKITHSLFN